MATYYNIPLTQNATWYSFNITLDSATYVFELRYNTRKDRWILSIYDAAENPLLVGIVLLIERNLSTQYNYLAIPQGVIFCQDDSGQGLQPTLSSFLVDHTLFYLSPL